jgi:hypothetical protein
VAGLEFAERLPEVPSRHIAVAHSENDHRVPSPP